MITRHYTVDDPRIQAAVAELTQLVRDRFPDATFRVTEHEEPCAIYVYAEVDVEDTDEVIDTYIDRMVDIQVYDGLPVYVIPAWPEARRIADYERRKASGQTAHLGRYADWL